MIAARRQTLLKDAVARLQAADVVAEGFVTDVADGDSARALADETISSLGPIDIVVNNVGGSFGDGFAAGRLLDMTEADVAGVIRANVTTVLNCCWAIVPKMIEHGSGTVINIASVVVRHPMPGLGLYSASKAAVASLTKTMAVEWGPEVRVNALLVGYIDTPRTAPLRSASHRQWLEQHIAMGRLGGPEDVAGAAVYLASDAAAWTTGAAIEVDGGVGAI